MKIRILLCTGLLFLFFNLAYALDWKKLHEEADKEDYNTVSYAVRQNPDAVDAIYKLALVCLDLHKDKEARDNFNKVLALDPKAYQARWGLAEVLRREHKVAESEKILNGVIEDGHGFSPVYITLGYIKYIRMDFNGAVAMASHVIDQGKDNVDLSNYTRAYLLYAGSKGMLAHSGGPFAKIISGISVLPNLKKAQKMQSNSAAVLYGLGSFYLLAPKVAGGNVDRAQDYFERSIKADPFFADAYVRLSQVYKLKGDEAKSKTYLLKAIKIDPGNELARDVLEKKCKFICVD